MRKSVVEFFLAGGAIGGVIGIVLCTMSCSANEGISFPVAFGFMFWSAVAGAIIASIIAIANNAEINREENERHQAALDARHREIVKDMVQSFITANSFNTSAVSSYISQCSDHYKPFAIIVALDHADIISREIKTLISAGGIHNTQAAYDKAKFLADYRHWENDIAVADKLRKVVDACNCKRVYFMSSQYGVASVEELAKLCALDYDDFGLNVFEYSLLVSVWNYAMENPCDLQSFNTIVQILENFGRQEQTFKLSDGQVAIRVSKGDKSSQTAKELQIFPINALAARIYASMHSEDLLAQLDDAVNAWVHYHLSKKDRESLIAFASFLKWAGLEHTERQIIEQIKHAMPNIPLET